MTASNTARTLEQDRANDAWSKVNAVKPPAIDDEKAKEYGSLARGAAADVLVNGLGMTLAFWKAKQKEHHLWLYESVSQWVLGQMEVSEQGDDLLEWLVTTASSEQYRIATAEALAYLTWIKRFAEAELPKGDANA